MADIIYKDLSYQVTGALYEVAHHMGPGLLEKCYQEALDIELRSRGLKSEREKRIKVQYKGIQLEQEYIADILVEDKIIIELKSVKELSDAHRAQTINYLRLTGIKLGILVNFYNPRIEIERLTNNNY